MREVDLSAREAEVLDALGERLTNAEIASRLFISVRTVESHVSALLRKTSVQNRRELADVARRRSAEGRRRRSRRPVPAPRTRLIGREPEVAAVARAFESAAVVTVTGPGGVGKTRLAIEVVRHVQGSHAAFVDLAGATDATDIGLTFVEALGLGDDSGRDWYDALVADLEGTPLLVLVDNCEHVLAAAAEVVAGLVGRGAAVRVLATSREPLALPGETVIALAPLQTPTGQEDLALLRGNPSVELFVERAAATDSSFAPDDAAMRSIASVCRRLDGIPLALELAAAQVLALSPKQIDDRLSDRFGLLRSPAHARPRRQATLETMLGWSYDLLDVRERALLDRLSVFRGTFSLDAVQEVATGAPVVADQLVDVFVNLVRKSLVVVVDDAGDEKRYRLLETVREYGRQRLVGAGELDVWRERHRDWMFARMREAATGLSDSVVPKWWHFLDDDIDNIEAALEWSLSTPDGASEALGLVRGLERYWMARGVRRAQGVRWSTEAAERATSLGLAERVEGLLGATLLLIWSDLDAAGALAHKATRLAGGGDDAVARGYAAVAGAWIALFGGDLATAERLGDDAAALLDRTDANHPWALVATETARALQGHDDARRRLRDAAAAVLEHRDRHMYGAWLSWSADVDVAAGDLATARGSVDVALDEARSAACASCESQALASAALLEESPEAQLQTSRVALRLAFDIDEPWGALAALEVVVGALSAVGAREDAVRLATAVRAARTSLGLAAVLPSRRAALDRGDSAARLQLPAAVVADLQQQGALLDYASAVALALG